MTAQGASTPRPRLVSATAGIGNSMGWFGGQVERYLAAERVSVFAGLGYTPSIDQGDPSGLTFAAGGRGFTSGRKHRGFLELSVSQIFIEQTFDGTGDRLYGPALQAGYQFVTGGGFTLMTSVGVGYAPGVPTGESKWGGVLGLGVGYTWCRQQVQ